MSENNKSCSFRTSIGGQALIEGILMRGPKKQAIVCRTQDGLVEKEEELHLLRDRYPVFGWPFLRGCVTFFDSMVKGMQALTYSASLVPLEEQGEPDKIDQWITDHFPQEKAEKLIIYVAVVLGILHFSSNVSGIADQTADEQLSDSKPFGRPFQGHHPDRLYGFGIQNERCQAPVFVSRRRTQDHFLL